MADVDVRGVRREACLVYVADASVGDWVVVHLGMALRQLDETSALETLAVLEELGALDEFGAVDAALADGVPSPPTGVPADERRTPW
ncbi:Hydrogenase expression/formation protein [Blastococcus saxobsidens DD2]|uniref:Hydrogenase expression/formation protein n=2 Tax=Blastococcus saxobsidens TaxID=138336 RepID=H6RNI2_BLASD|nr:Hydrogenase expression/formation protein [Blastococcus saxobsidens DD2]